MASQEYDSIMLCGGIGERLTSIAGITPKPLFKVAGKELIQYSIDSLDSVVDRHVFAVDFGAIALQKWAETTIEGHDITFSQQKKSGVLGAIEEGTRAVTKDSFIVCNTDEIRLRLNPVEAIRCHEASGAIATMVVTRSDKLHRHRKVEVRNDGIIAETHLKPEAYSSTPNITGLVNTGFLIMHKDAAEYFDPQHSKDWSGIIDPLCDAGELNAYVDQSIKFFNVGTAEEYYEAENYFKTKYQTESVPLAHY